jgi:hypothetical protein
MKQGCLAVAAELRKSLKPDPDNAGVGSFMKPIPSSAHRAIRLPSACMAPVSS